MSFQASKLYKIRVLPADASQAGIANTGSGEQNKTPPANPFSVRSPGSKYGRGYIAHLPCDNGVVLNNSSIQLLGK